LLKEGTPARLSNLGSDTLAGIRIQIRQDDRRSFAREQQGCRASYARCPARDQRNFARKLHT
jgi:hypothetical protein